MKTIRALRATTRPATKAVAATLLLTALAVAAAMPGEPAPDFALKSVAGDNLRLSEYRGEVVLLSFWATWCGDCRAQAAALAEVHRRYGDAGVELLGISLDQTLKQAGETAAALQMPYAVLHDPGGTVGELYGVDKMPVVVLIDRAGVVREVVQGFRRGETDYLPRVQALLRE